MRPGTVYADRYVIEALAGKGGMGSVFRARDTDGSHVALKIVQTTLDEAERRFDREARLLCSLQHPTIVQYLDSGTTADGQHYLVMEWLEGEDLKERLRKERLFVSQTLQLICRVAQALAVAHDHGIVHRDVKPANIFLPGGDVTEAKLIDFGLARLIHSNQVITSMNTLFGTPAYMSPEYVNGPQSIDAASDVFALGCILYECLTGDPAFSASNSKAVFFKILFESGPYVREVAPWIPEEIEVFLQRMLAKDPAQRLRNGAEVAAAVEEVASRFPDMVLPSTPHTPRRGSITESEQRWANVVVATVGEDSGVLPAMLAGAADRGPDSSTWTSQRNAPGAEPAAHDLEAVRARLEVFGAKAGALGGNTLMAVFETPDITSWRTAIDQAIDAAHCALLLRDALPDVPVAMASGQATMGQTRLLGDVIERAVSLLEPDAAGTIRVDETSMELLASRFDFRGEIGGAISLMRERSVDSERTLLGRPLPFVGRKRELSMLIATLEECVEESAACAVLITGSPGAGKSRLRQELVQHVTEELTHVDVCMARGDPMRADSPLEMLAEVIRSYVGLVESAPAAVRHETLRARVAELLPADDVDRVATFLAELLKIPAAQPDNVQLAAARLDPVLMGDQIRRACKDLMAALTATRAVLVVLEDLHWGDRATVAMLDQLLGELVERPLVVVALGRPEMHEKFPQLWSRHNVTEIRLGRLPRRAAERLVRAIMGSAAEDERVAAIVEHADGNAFYLRELARSAAAGRLALPDTVLAMVQTRLGALDPQARQILRAASIFGRRFWRGGVAAMLGKHVPIDDWLYKLVDDELISAARDSRFPGESEYAFRHALIREGAYNMLTDKDRQLGHRLAGEWLEEVGEPDEQVLAEHFERGDAPPKALPHYVHAAQNALDRSDFPSASALAERGIRCGAEGPLLGALRRVQIEVKVWRQSTAEVTSLCEEALELLPRGSRAWYEVIGEAALAWGRLGDLAHVEELAELVQTTDMEHDDHAGRQRAIAKLAVQFLFTGHINRANLLLQELEAEVGDLDQAEPVTAANIHFARALHASIALRDPATLLEELERCARRFEEIGNLRQAYLHRANAGYARAELGLDHEAELELRAVLQAAETLAVDLAVSTTHQTLGLVLARRGQLEEARALVRRAIARFEGQDARMEGWSRIDLGMILLLASDLRGAESEVRSALALLPDTAPLRPMALATLSRILRARGDKEPALIAARQGIELLTSLPAVESGESLVRLVFAEALQASGDMEAAQAAIQSARNHLLARAERISRSDWRESFLHNIPENARTLELAERWLSS